MICHATRKSEDRWKCYINTRLSRVKMIKDKHYIMIEGSIHQRGIVRPNVHAYTYQS